MSGSPESALPRKEIPVVDYLVLGAEPHLVGQRCVRCSAEYFGRRVACAACFERTFTEFAVPRQGELVAFSIVHQAAPGVPVPYIAGCIDCGGTMVRANVVHVAPDPDALRLGTTMRLTTFSVGSDLTGTEAVAFGFEPVR